MLSFKSVPLLNDSTAGVEACFKHADESGGVSLLEHEACFDDWQGSLAQTSILSLLLKRPPRTLEATFPHCP